MAFHQDDKGTDETLQLCNNMMTRIPRQHMYKHFGWERFWFTSEIKIHVKCSQSTKTLFMINRYEICCQHKACKHNSIARWVMGVKLNLQDPWVLKIPISSLHTQRNSHILLSVAQPLLPGTRECPTVQWGRGLPTLARPETLMKSKVLSWELRRAKEQ